MGSLGERGMKSDYDRVANESRPWTPVPRCPAVPRAKGTLNRRHNLGARTFCSVGAADA